MQSKWTIQKKVKMVPVKYEEKTLDAVTITLSPKDAYFLFLIMDSDGGREFCEKYKRIDKVFSVTEADECSWNIWSQFEPEGPRDPEYLKTDSFEAFVESLSARLSK